MSKLDDAYNKVVLGVAASITGFAIDILLDVFGTVPADQIGIYHEAISATVLLINIYAVISDLESIQLNGPFYLFGFLSSTLVLKGHDVVGSIGISLIAPSINDFLKSCTFR